MIGVKAPPELLGIHANMAGAEREPPLKEERLFPRREVPAFGDPQRLYVIEDSPIGLAA